MVREIGFALRAIWRSPGFAFMAVLTLGLGIGANTAIFSVVNAVLLRPLPYPEAGQLVRAYSLFEGHRWTVPPPDYVDWRRNSRTLEDIGAYERNSPTLSGDGPAQRLSGATVSQNLFSVLGVGAAFGRGFQPDDAVPGRDHVVILSHGLWEERFGSDTQVIGRTITINGTSHVVVGVMPAGFEYPAGAELWQPLALTDDDLITQRGLHYLSLVGRLRADVRVEDAAADLRALAARLEEEYPGANKGWSAAVLGLQESMVGDVRPALLLLLGAVGLVLLIACANVANLVLVRTLERDRELAVRAALGASHFRLLRGLLVESLTLAAFGAVAGLLLAVWGTDLLRLLGPEDIPRLSEVRIDATVLAFTGGAAVLTAILFGLLPGMRAAFAWQLRDRLTEGGRTLSAHRATRRARNALVIGEVAMAVTLVTGSLLLIRSFLHLNQVDPGFNTERLLTLSLSLPSARYREPHQARDYYRELIQRVQALPGVETVDAVFGLPLSGFSSSISISELDGRRPPVGEEPSLQVRIVTPGYFAHMGIPLVEGREFLDSDREGAPLVAVVNQSAARLLWGGADPLGRNFSLGMRMGLSGELLGGTVVGVVRDVKHFGLDNESRPEGYFIQSQFPIEDMSLVVRTSVSTASLVGPATQVVRDLDPEVPAYEVRTMVQLLRQSVAEPRFYMLLLATFAGTALALAGVGIYGVTSHTAAQRTRELGIRIALGAHRGEVLRMVLAHGLALGVAGVAIGTIAAAATSRLLSGLLFQVAPTDLATFIAVPVFLLSVTLAACWVPAQRATRVDPVEALRAE